MFWKRKKPETGKPAEPLAQKGVWPQPAPDAAPAFAPVAREIAIADLSELVTSSGRTAVGTVEDGQFGFTANQGGRSVQSLPASEGDVFVASALVSALSRAPGCKNAQFAFGPVFFDAEGNIVRFWSTFDAPSDTPTELTVKSKAPANTASVRLFIRGPKGERGEGPDYTLGVRSAKLEKLAG